MRMVFNRVSRRRACAVLLTLILTVALMLTIAPRAQAKSSKINSMDITCVIDENGDAVITELIDIDAYEGTEYYQVVNIRGNQTIQDLKVTENGTVFQDAGPWDTEASDKRNKSGIVNTDSGYELCFGIGDYGNHVFEMQYTVVNFVSRWSDRFGVNYMFFSNLPLKIDSATVTLSGPVAYSDDNASIWSFGYDGSVVFEDGKVFMESDNSKLRGMQLLMVFEDSHSFTHTNDIDSNREFMDIYEEAEEGSSYAQEESGSFISKIGPFIPYVVIGGILAITALFATPSNKKIYEDKEGYQRAKSKDVSEYRDIPCGKDLVVFSTIWGDMKGSFDSLKSTLVSAYILKWLQNNNISIVEGAETGVFKKIQTYRIILSDQPSFYDVNEKLLYGILWEAAGADHILEKNEFQRYCKRNYTDVNQWFDKYKNAGLDRLRQMGLIHSGASTEKRLIGKRNRTVDLYTVAYNAEVARVNGFHRFLESEDNMSEKSMIEVKLWDEYLIFAAVMGIADTVYRQIKVAVPQFNDRYYGYDPYMAYLVANDFGRAGAQGVAAGASSSGGSSSFGGGGSSFSGGGGGGLR